MSNKKRTYTSAFKTKIVLEALREEKSIAELSVKYNITPKNIHNWKATFLSNAEIAMEPSKCVAEYKQATKELNQQVADYAKKVGELTMEKEFLEGKLKSLALSDRKLMIDAKHILPINKQAELLSIARSTIYYKPVENTYKKSVLEKLKKIHNEIPCYGYIKAHRQLLEDGYSISENTVHKYRQELDIKAILAVKKPNLSLGNKEHAIYSYKLRDVEILHSNQVWSTDITYIKTASGTVYLAAIIDWHSKAAVVVVMVFFPMLVNTVAGLNAKDNIQHDLMKTYGASYWQNLLKLNLPAAMPFIFNGLKICTTLALIGAIVSEFFGSPTRGMGFRISTEVGRLSLDMVWAEITVAAFAGSAFYGLMALIEKGVTFWHPSQRK